MKFQGYAANADQFVAELAEELGLAEDVRRAERILRSVLHGLRERLSVQASARLVAHLPMMIKAVYVDGWSLGRGRAGEGAFFEGPVEGAEGAPISGAEAVGAFFRALRRHVSADEAGALVAALPTRLVGLWRG